MTQIPRSIVLLGGAALMAAAGCSSLSASSDSVSKSVTEAFDSVSKSSTSSSGGGKSEGAMNYRRDVEAFSVAWLDRAATAPSTETTDELSRGLRLVAELHGVTDWQASPDTRAALDEVARDPELDAARRARLQEELARLGIEVRD